jgi:hypothetical protein
MDDVNRRMIGERKRLLAAARGNGDLELIRYVIIHMSPDLGFCCLLVLKFSNHCSCFMSDTNVLGIKQKVGIEGMHLPRLFLRVTGRLRRARVFLPRRAP